MKKTLVRLRRLVERAKGLVNPKPDSSGMFPQEYRWRGERGVVRYTHTFESKFKCLKKSLQKDLLKDIRTLTERGPRSRQLTTRFEVDEAPFSMKQSNVSRGRHSVYEFSWFHPVEGSILIQNFFIPRKKGEPPPRETVLLPPRNKRQKGVVPLQRKKQR